MRLLFVIPHYFNDQGSGKYGSTRAGGKQLRINALSSSLRAINQLFGNSNYILNIAQRHAVKTNVNTDNQIKIIFCTNKDSHLLDNIPLNSDIYSNHNIYDSDFNPMMLGFEAQRIFRDNLGTYDYYCYMEDDLILHDPYFFDKLQYFNRLYGDSCLLLPNRYEASLDNSVNKLYVDGDIRPDITAKYQNHSHNPILQLNFIGEMQSLHRPLNPHSGCYFLNCWQMERWVAQPHYLDRDTSFIGPLESVATLGIMKTFNIYKPSVENSYFLEIEHSGNSFLSLLGKNVLIKNCA